ncbi:MAG: DNA polymerase IV, partial [Pseudomonadales bacterium]|nr:DNA polymerase IV [Pseudomonadales bacterium]
KKAFVKLKFSDFSTTTMERCIGEPNLQTYRNLCEEAFKRKNMAVRLLGVGVRFQEPSTAPESQIAFNF